MDRQTKKSPVGEWRVCEKIMWWRAPYTNDWVQSVYQLHQSSLGQNYTHKIVREKPAPLFYRSKINPAILAQNPWTLDPCPTFTSTIPASLHPPVLSNRGPIHMRLLTTLRPAHFPRINAAPLAKSHTNNPQVFRYTILLYFATPSGLIPTNIGHIGSLINFPSFQATVTSTQLWNKMKIGHGSQDARKTTENLWVQYRFLVTVLSDNFEPKVLLPTIFPKRGWK